MSGFTKSQIDRLGDRLREGAITEDDLQRLDAYRQSFAPAYEAVVDAIRSELNLNPTGRPAKSTTSISDKLRRESLRLSQMQDIAGCRAIVSDVLLQDETVKRLTERFDDVHVFDRRKSPSHGYRAIHVIVRHHNTAIEVQIRTVLQHGWAELSEKFSDVVDPSMKYGGGPAELRSMLLDASDIVGKIEGVERKLLTVRLLPEKQESIAEIAQEFDENKRQFSAHLGRMVEHAHLWKND